MIEQGGQFKSSTSYSSSTNRYPIQKHGHMKFAFSYSIRTLDSSIYIHTTKMNEVKTEKNQPQYQYIMNFSVSFHIKTRILL